MDLSHPLFRPDRELTVLPRDVAAVTSVLGLGGASATASAQQQLDAPAPDRFHPAHGSFDAAVAAALWRWRDEGRDGGAPG